MRHALVLALLAALGAAEAVPAPDAARPSLAFRAGSTRLSLAPDQPSEASGGVVLRYEEVRLECERLGYRLAALPGAARPVLASAELAAGEGGRMLFDTTATRLPEMAFRGVLRPRSVAIRRLEVDPAWPAEVRFRAEALGLDDIVGVVLTAAGPKPHLAWADRATLEFVAAPDPASNLGIGPPRLSALHFHGRPAGDGVAARPATVLRLKRPASAAESTVAGIPADAIGMRAAGMRMSLLFDAQGRLSGYLNDTGDYEVYDGDDLIPRLGRPPAPGP